MEILGSMAWKWNASSKDNQWKQHKNFDKVRFISNFIQYSFLNYNIMEILGSIKWKWNASSREKDRKQHKNFDKV